MLSLDLMFHLRFLAQIALVASVLFAEFADLTPAVSKNKKFIEGFLMGTFTT